MNLRDITVFGSKMTIESVSKQRRPQENCTETLELMDITKYLYHLQQNIDLDFCDEEYEMPDDWLYSGEAALQLAEAGLSLWGYKAWESDILRIIESPTIAMMGRIESIASFLLSVCPPVRQDSKLCGSLRYIADREWSVVNQGAYSLYPRMSLARKTGAEI